MNSSEGDFLLRQCVKATHELLTAGRQSPNEVLDWNTAVVRTLGCSILNVCGRQNAGVAQELRQPQVIELLQVAEMTEMFLR
ncbi:MAG TPA: hypothetical protein VJN21_02010 [Candidatus Acidoferrales bacterium]|nr:hypothetical protein [Candidatus Acidoferrales bacterium]